MLKVAIIAVLISCLMACSVAPVKPWQRGNFAKAVMQKNSSRQQTAFETHSYTSKEGSAGSVAIDGGGCGCN